MDAIREVFERQFAKDEVTKEMSDEQIGQITRARMTGIERVGDALREISSHKVVPKTEKEINPAY